MQERKMIKRKRKTFRNMHVNKIRKHTGRFNRPTQMRPYKAPTRLRKPTKVAVLN